MEGEVCPVEGEVCHMEGECVLWREMSYGEPVLVTSG